MSVELIKSYLELYEQGDATIPDRYGLLVEQRRLTAERLEEMNKQMKVIDEKVDTYYDKMALSKKQAGN